jgi:cell division protein FtsZ
MFEVDEAAKIITEAVDPEANIIFWAVIDEKYSWEVKVTVIATWFSEETQWTTKPKITPAMERMWAWRTMNTSNWQDDLDVPAFIRKAVK